MCTTKELDTFESLCSKKACCKLQACVCLSKKWTCFSAGPVPLWSAACLASVMTTGACFVLLFSH